MLKTMLGLKGAAHLRTVRQIKSSRSTATSTGLPTVPLDRGRAAFEYARLAYRERYRRGFGNLRGRRCRPLK